MGFDGFGALKIMVSEHALEETDVRLFPESKNRSRRIHKKLVKRFGGEFRKVPCIWKTPQGLIAHPAMYERLKREVAPPQIGAYFRSNNSIASA